MAKRLLYFRDDKGRFVAGKDRYTKATSIQAYREGELVTVLRDKITPERLAMVTSKPEFESLPEVTRPIKTFSSKKKYKLWDIADQIDKQKGLRRKLLKLTINVMDGQRLRKVELYHEITANQPRSYQLFKRFNEHLGIDGLVAYDKVGGKLMADRRGKKVKVQSVMVEEVYA